MGEGDRKAKLNLPSGTGPTGALGVEAKAMRPYLLLGVLLALGAAALAAPVVPVDGGLFFEAEAYDGRPWYGSESFATRQDEPLGSGGAVLIGMYAPGAVLYQLTVPAAGDYQVWMRCAVPGDAPVKFGANAAAEADLRETTVSATTVMAKLTAEGAYQWRHLGAVALHAGANTFVLGQGPQRPDCFFLTPQADFTPGEDFLDRVQRAREAPRGKLLPELRHDREITRHPQWLLQRGWRPAYAHFEWDKTNTPQSWAKRARETGATCLVGVGEMPAGTLNGKLAGLPFAKIDDPAFKYPEGYRPDDYSWVKEYADAGHAEGLKVVIYDGSHRTLDPLLLAHPDWRQQDAAGRPYGDGFGSWHSPYRQAYIQRWVQVARESGLDGIMVDMLFTAPRGGDYSPWTVQAFKQRFGVEPPRQEDYRDLTWQRWVDFQAWTREEVMLDLTEALHAVNPEIACIWNQTVGWVFTGNSYLTSRAGRCADGLLEEMGWEVSHGNARQRPCAWPLQSAWQSLFLHCRTAYGQMWHLNGFYTRVNHEALSYSMFGNGLAPGVVTGGNWEFMQTVWSHLEPCEAHLTGATLEPWAALHFSENTLRWYANARGPEARNAYLMNVFGLFQALVEAHLPVAIITDDDLEQADRLRPYATVLLPNSAGLSDRQAAALETYAQQGGGVLATFETGLYDENGTRREAAALAKLLGVQQGAVNSRADWSLSTAQTHPLVNVPEVANGGDPGQGSRERRATVQFFRATTDRQAGVVKTVAGPDVASVPLQGAGAGYSTLHTRAAGQGRVVYFPLDLGRAYFTYNHPITRLLITRAVRWSAGTPPPLVTNAPLAVQTVCYRQGAERIVNLINDNSSFGRAAAPNPENFGAFRDEVLPIHDVTVQVPGIFREAKLLPQGVALPVTVAEGASQVTVPKLEIHAMVVFSP